MGKTFYEAETPEDATKRYLQANNTLYDNMKNEVIKEVLCSVVNSWDSLKVLEVGAGGGIWTDFFVRQGADVTCIDSCEQILKGNAKLHPEAKFILADATTVTLKEKFDLIFAKDIMEHIERDIDFLRSMNRHLKKDGLLLITTQNALSLNYLIEGGFNFIRGNKNWCGWDPTHVRFYTPKSLNKELKTIGFEVTKYFGVYHFPYRFISQIIFTKVLERRVFHFVEALKLYGKFPFDITGWNIRVVAKKITEDNHGISP